MKHPLSPAAIPVLAGLLLLVAACGGGGDSSGGSGGDDSGSTAFLVGDAPTDGLSRAVVTLTSVRLLPEGGGPATAELLTAPRAFDFLGLQTRQALLAVTDPPPGRYVGARVQVDAASVDLRDSAGAPVPVTVTDDVGTADFTLFGGPLVVDAAFDRVLLDLDLDESLTPDPAVSGGFLFAPVLRGDSSFEDALLDEFRGRVTSVDASGNSFRVEIVEGAAAGSFGILEVRVSDGDFLLDDDGATFATAAAFLAALAVGDVVEVHGALLASGVFDASKVEIEDGLDAAVEIEGRIVALDPVAGTFDLLWKEIERGVSIARPVLASLGDPAVLTVSFDAQTRVVGEDSGASQTGNVPAALAVGQEVDVRFASFAAPMPFPARSIEVDGDGPEYEGTITSVAGLPSSFVMQLDSDEPAWTSGAVTGPITVSLASAPRIFLDAGPEPALEEMDLLAGLKVEVHGTLSGPASASTLAATRVKVEPGELEGTVVSVSLGARTVTVQGVAVEDPFGGPALGGSVVVQVPAGARIETDSGSADLADVAGQLNVLGAGEVLEIEVEGIGDGAGGVFGWELETEVEDS